MLHLYVPFFALLVHALLVPFALIGGRKQIKPEQAISLLLLLIITARLYWTTPYSAQAGITNFMGNQFRYGFPLMGTLGICAAVGTTMAQVREEYVIATALFSAGAVLSLDQSNMLYFAVLLLLMAGLSQGGQARELQNTVKNFLDKLKWLSTSGPFIAAPVVLAMIIGTSFFLREMRDTQRNQTYGGILEYLEQNGNGKKTGYLLSDQSYLLYGKNLNRQVVYVPPPSDNLQQWVKMLRQHKVDLVAIGPLRQARREIHWVENPAGPFIRVFGADYSSGPVLYRFRKD